MIILEGPDGAGKTTLLEDIQQHLGNFALPISPRVVSKDTKSMVPSIKAWVEDNVRGGFQPTLFDRHRLISEPIYGAIIRNHFEPGFDDFNWLYLMYYQFYNRCKPLIIYCIPPFDEVKRNMKKDYKEQPKDVREGIRKIYALYMTKAATDAALHGAMEYDYTQPLRNRDHIFTAVDAAIHHSTGQVNNVIR